MAADKLYRRLEAKIDALLGKAGIDPADFGDSAPAPREERTLTAAEQQAIDNAPKPTPVPQPAVPRRTTTTNAPDTSSSVPKDAVGSVTVETKTPNGKTKVETKPAK